MEGATRRWPTSPSQQEIESRFSHVVRRADFDHYRVYSAWHELLGFKWRLLIFPKGNKIDGEDIAHMSVYLDCGGPIDPAEKNEKKEDVHESDDDDDKKSGSIDCNSWSRCASFSLHLMKAKLLNDKLDGSAEAAKVAGLEENAQPLVMSQSTESFDSLLNEEMCGVCKDSSHSFTERVSDWGFLEFVSLSSLEEGPYADADGHVTIMVGISFKDNVSGVQKCDEYDDWLKDWNSKERTGYNGLTSNRSTGYLNATLQTLYCVGAVRTEVYRLPVAPACAEEELEFEVNRALRDVFKDLERATRTPGTAVLTNAFGWDSRDRKQPHDMHELKVCLFNGINQGGTKIDPSPTKYLSALFEGVLENRIKCVDVDYQSVTEEVFFDLWLSVSRCRDIYESFEKYTEVEVMDGDNKYHAEGFNELQAARKCVKFKKLPSVLQLFLRRSRYDFSRSTTVKVNDQYEFEKEIDLNRFVENSDGSDVFVLHSVIVFEDGLEDTGGHYYAFIRTDLDTGSNGTLGESSRWLRFEDSSVTFSNDEAAFQGNFGLGGEKDSNAYMLQYLRKSELPELLTAEPCGDGYDPTGSEGGNDNPAEGSAGLGSPPDSEVEDEIATQAPGDDGSVVAAPVDDECAAGTPGDNDSAAEGPGDSETAPEAPGENEIMTGAVGGDESVAEAQGDNESEGDAAGKNESAAQVPGDNLNASEAPGDNETAVEVPEGEWDGDAPKDDIITVAAQGDDESATDTPGDGIMLPASETEIDDDSNGESQGDDESPGKTQDLCAIHNRAETASISDIQENSAD